MGLDVFNFPCTDTTSTREENCMPNLLATSSSSDTFLYKLILFGVLMADIGGQQRPTEDDCTRM